MSDLHNLIIPSAQGNRNRRSQPLEFQILRELGEEDLPQLLNPEPTGVGVSKIKELKQGHHHLAQVLAQGIPQVKASLMTGYSMNRISVLKNDPAFAELLDFYRTNQEIKFAEVTERKARLGISMLDELQNRLEDDPEKFTNRELLDGTEMLLRADGNGGAAQPAVNLSVSFVNPGAGGGVVLDGEAG
jgi:hypothetical protein